MQKIEAKFQYIPNISFIYRKDSLSIQKMQKKNKPISWKGPSKKEIKSLGLRQKQNMTD